MRSQRAITSQLPPCVRPSRPSARGSRRSLRQWSDMRLHVIPSPFYAANGLVLVPSGAGTALVVDPSAGIQRLIREVLDCEGVSVGAVLLTHGHPDHVWDAAQVSTWGEAGVPVPVYLPGPDMYRMDDPASFLPMAPPDFVGSNPSPCARCLLSQSRLLRVCVCAWYPRPVTPRVRRCSLDTARWTFA